MQWLQPRAAQHSTGACGGQQLIRVPPGTKALVLRWAGVGAAADARSQQRVLERGQVLATCAQSILGASGIAGQSNIGHHRRRTRAAASCLSRREAVGSDLTESSPPQSRLRHLTQLCPMTPSCGHPPVGHPSAPAPATSLLMHSSPSPPPPVTRPRVPIVQLSQHSSALLQTQTPSSPAAPPQPPDPATPQRAPILGSPPILSPNCWPHPALAFTAYSKQAMAHLRQAELKGLHSWLTCTAGEETKHGGGAGES